MPHFTYGNCRLWQIIINYHESPRFGESLLILDKTRVIQVTREQKIALSLSRLVLNTLDRI